MVLRVAACQFIGHWEGHQGPVEWLARSPDI